MLLEMTSPRDRAFNTAISGMIEMLLFSIIPRVMRVETNSGQEKVEHFALSMLNHFKNRCNVAILENTVLAHKIAPNGLFALQDANTRRCPARCP
jgi:hypothetical protein